MIDPKAAELSGGLHGVCWGEGARRVVVLHGWGGDHRTAAPLGARRPEGVSVYGVDLPGIGGSAAPLTWDIEGVVDALEEGLEGLGGGLTLVGSCSGALLGLVLARRQPGRFARLVLIEPFAYMPWFFRIFTWWCLGPMLYWLVFANPLGRWITRLKLRRQQGEGDLTGGFEEVDHRAAWRHLKLLSRMDSPEKFATLSAEIDLVHGSRTFDAMHTSVARWCEVWPGARVLEVEGGHVPLESQPDALARLVFGDREGG